MHRIVLIQSVKNPPYARHSIVCWESDSNEYSQWCLGPQMTLCECVQIREGSSVLGAKEVAPSLLLGGSVNGFLTKVKSNLWNEVWAGFYQNKCRGRKFQREEKECAKTKREKAGCNLWPGEHWRIECEAKSYIWLNNICLMYWDHPILGA